MHRTAGRRRFAHGPGHSPSRRRQQRVSMQRNLSEYHRQSCCQQSVVGGPRYQRLSCRSVILGSPRAPRVPVRGTCGPRYQVRLMSGNQSEKALNAHNGTRQVPVYPSREHARSSLPRPRHVAAGRRGISRRRPASSASAQLDVGERDAGGVAVTQLQDAAGIGLLGCDNNLAVDRIGDDVQCCESAGFPRRRARQCKY